MQCIHIWNQTDLQVLALICTCTFEWDIHKPSKVDGSVYVTFTLNTALPLNYSNSSTLSAQAVQKMLYWLYLSLETESDGMQSQRICISPQSMFSAAVLVKPVWLVSTGCTQGWNRTTHAEVLKYTAL